MRNITGGLGDARGRSAAKRRTPSSRYSGERAGERGQVRVGDSQQKNRRMSLADRALDRLRASPAPLPNPLPRRTVEEGARPPRAFALCDYAKRSHGYLGKFTRSATDARTRSPTMNKMFINVHECSSTTRNVKTNPRHSGQSLTDLTHSSTFPAFI